MSGIHSARVFERESGVGAFSADPDGHTVLTDLVSVVVNGTSMALPYGTTVAVAVLLQGAACRKSVTDKPRGPLCGMGICFECRVEINGERHCRSCQIVCESGMRIRAN